MRARDLDAIIASGMGAVLVSVAETKGSTPRETGARIIVTEDATLGTIGGGALEFRAIDKARQMLAAGGSAKETMDLPLGPEIGQCCGGRVVLSLRTVDRAMLEDLREELTRRQSGQPIVLIFGGGHVGTALARALAPLPFRTRMIETRADVLPADLPVPHSVLAMPEQEVRTAPAGSAVVVLTHDHALDYLIVSEALRRDDLAYVGLIGSKTKRATFENRWRREGHAALAMQRLVCPIGGDAVKDKRPEVIAALAVAEIATALLDPAR
ncbi:xanthine dehydrogenase accessory protein XdhC [Notoacmeibacter marinus]|uniref:xanthine dehydrogenase accessory protein XdhC n=1 Tax=Notoacmeibacter marinus TaxID=1876515 RepID=UPI000DF42981|nr:xanthine dehydrogenase accessory protein XdhC [Notoacmeibacter marinus]